MVVRRISYYTSTPTFAVLAHVLPSSPPSFFNLTRTSGDPDFVHFQRRLLNAVLYPEKNLTLRLVNVRARTTHPPAILITLFSSYFPTLGQGRI